MKNAMQKKQEMPARSAATVGGKTVVVQPKLTVNQPGDRYEQEADRVADAVMGMKDGDAPVLQRMPLSPVSAVQRESSSSEGAGAAPAIVSEVLSSGGGRALDSGTQQFMESRFGRGFSEVRVHDDSRAADSAAAIQARAYTSGQDVVFGQGEYRPESAEGRRLLAHELGHVGQQGERSEKMIQRTRRRGQTQGLNTEFSRRDKRDSARGKISIFDSGISSKIDSWNTAAMRLGTAYRTSSDQFKQALEGRNAEMQANNQLFFSILTIGCSGALSWLVEANQLARQMERLNSVANPSNIILRPGSGIITDISVEEAERYVGTLTHAQRFNILNNRPSQSLLNQQQSIQTSSETLNDTLSAAVGEISSLGPVYLPPDMSNIDIDPHVYQNQLQIKVSRLSANKNKFIRDLLVYFETRPMTFWDSYNLQELDNQIANWDRTAEQMASDEDLPQDDSYMSMELERGLWKRWLPGLRQMRLNARTDVQYYVYESLGSQVERRLSALGITRASGVRDFGWFTSENEMELVIQWAMRYRVRPFTSQRR